MTGLLNLFGLCTMEQLHRNMEEVVGVKHELARREAEIGELRPSGGPHTDHHSDAGSGIPTGGHPFKAAGAGTGEA